MKRTMASTVTFGSLRNTTGDVMISVATQNRAIIHTGIDTGGSSSSITTEKPKKIASTVGKDVTDFDHHICM